MENPLLGPQPLPPFADIRPEHVEPAIQALLTENRARIEELAALTNPSFASLVEPLEDMQHRLSRVWSPVSHLNAVMNSPSLREAYNACLPLLSAYQTDLAQSEPLYRAYQQIAAREGPSLEPTQRRVLEHALRDFRLAGVGLDSARKERFKAVMLELTQLQAKFEENVLDATNGWRHTADDRHSLEGLNQTIVEQARRRAEDLGSRGYILSLDQPTYVAVMTDEQSPALRRAFYQAWTTRASDRGSQAGRWDNSEVMTSILRLRHEVAQLLGFSNYADYALATRMARSVEQVVQFLSRLAEAARPAALRELSELHAFAGRPLAAWDLSYYSERLQRTRFAVS